MKKTLALTLLFVFTLAITTPVMANVNPQEPVKKEQTTQKKSCKKECKQECKKECSKKKTGEKKNAEKKKNKEG